MKSMSWFTLASLAALTVSACGGADAIATSGPEEESFDAPPVDSASVPPTDPKSIPVVDAQSIPPTDPQSIPPGEGGSTPGSSGGDSSCSSFCQRMVRGGCLPDSSAEECVSECNASLSGDCATQARALSSCLSQQVIDCSGDNPSFYAGCEAEGEALNACEDGGTLHPLGVEFVRGRGTSGSIPASGRAIE